MKKIKLASFLMALLCVPGITKAADTEVFVKFTDDITSVHYISYMNTMSALVQDPDYDGSVYMIKNTTLSKTTWPAAYNAYANDFDCGDFHFECRTTDSSLGYAYYPKLTTQKSGSFAISKKPFVVISNVNDMGIKSITLCYAEDVTNMNAIEQLQIEGYTRSEYANREVTFTFDGELPPSKITLTKTGDNDTYTYLSGIVFTLTSESGSSENPGENPGEDPQTPEVAETVPYSQSFAEGEDYDAWSLYRNSSRFNPWNKKANGLEAIYDSSGAHDFWATSPKITLKAGKTYTVSVDVSADCWSAKNSREILNLAISDEKPDADTEFFKTFEILKFRNSAKDLADNVKEQNYSYVYSNTLKALVSVAKDGDYYLGVFDSSYNDGDYLQWAYFYVEGFRIVEGVDIDAEFTGVAKCLPEAGKEASSIVLGDTKYKDGKVEFAFVCAPVSLTVNASAENPTLVFDGRTITLPAPVVTDGKVVWTLPVEQFLGLGTYTLTVPDGYFTFEGKAVKGASASITTEPGTPLPLEMVISDNFRTIAFDLGGEYTDVIEGNPFNFTVFTVKVGTALPSKISYTPSLEFAVPQAQVGQTMLFTLAAGSIVAVEKVDGYTSYYTNDETTLSAVYRIREILEGVVYELDKSTNECTVVGDQLPEGDYVIPSSKNIAGENYKVVAIADKAFKDSKVTNLVIPETIEVLGSKLFEGAENLEKVFMLAPKNLKEYTLDTFDGVSVVYVPVGNLGASIGAHVDLVEANIVTSDNEVNLVDGYPFYGFGYNYRDKGFTYERAFTNTSWQPLFLPATADISYFLDHGRVAKLVDAETSADGTESLVWEYVSDDEWFEAHTPYIFKADEVSTVDDPHVIEVGSAMLYTHAIDVENKPVESSNYRYTLHGSYESEGDLTGTDIFSRKFFLQNGSFRFTNTEDAYIKPMRYYLTIAKANAAAPADIKIRNVIREGDTVTAIDELPMDVIFSDTYYDLQGRKVENPTAGVYIVNGRKVVIK